MPDVLRSALRQIRSQPGFAAAVVLTIAVGVGATTAVFTLADPMLFRALPFPEPERLVRIRVDNDGQSQVLRVGDFLRIAREHRGFEAVANFGATTVARVEGLGDEMLLFDGVGQAYFSTLRLQPAIGRPFAPEEYGTRTPLPDVAIITYGLWQSAFGGRGDVIGQVLRTEGQRPHSFQIVGVLPQSFVPPGIVNRQPQVLLPIRHDPAEEGNPNFGTDLMARLAPGVSLDAAVAEAQAIVTANERDNAQYPQGRRVVGISLHEALFGTVRTPLLMLLGATGCALLLACANLAQLFLARLHARQREIGVRIALGAGTWRLVQQFFVEALVLALLGGLTALVVARWTFDLIMARVPDFGHVYRLLPAAMDLRVVGFAAGLVALSLLVYGVAPAILATRADVRAALQRGGTSTPAWGRRDAALIFLQSAMALALLVTGSLIVRSYVSLSTQDIGFEPHRVQSVNVEPASGTEPGAAVQMRQRVFEELRERLPQPVALAGAIPGLTIIARGDRPDFPTTDRQTGRLYLYPVSASFFDVFGLRLTRGRLFTEVEAFSNAAVAVVDERAAATLWPRVSIVVRADHDDAAPLSAARQIAADAAPAARVTFTPVRPFERTLGQPRFLAVLLGALSVVAVILTVVGVFGVVNHEVVRRTREVGIRMALGASAGRIRRFLLSRAIVPALLGVVAGTLASLWWTPTLEALLFGLESHDPSSFALAAALVLVTVCAAGFAPAWRASRTDPTDALRVE